MSWKLIRDLAAEEGALRAALDLYRAGGVDRKTMREFDVRCLTTVEDLSARDIQNLRKREGISQAVLALCLNVTANYVSQIERGAKRPRGATLKLLSLIRVWIFQHI